MTTEIQVKIWRGPGAVPDEPYFETFQVPLKNTMSVTNVLQYINEHLEGGLAFYVSCRRGLCRGCVLRVNERPVLACSHIVSGDIVVEPLDPARAIRDLVVES